MKIIILKSAVLTILLLWGSVSLQAENKQCELEVDVTGIRNNKGSIKLGLYNEAHDDFPGEGREFKSVNLKIENKIASHTFSTSCGSYAIAVFHDENENGKMDKNMIGLPEEGYAFSNNHPDSKFGPPAYPKVEFKLKKTLKIEIHMIYLL